MSTVLHYSYAYIIHMRCFVIIGLISYGVLCVTVPPINSHKTKQKVSFIFRFFIQNLNMQ